MENDYLVLEIVSIVVRFSVVAKLNAALNVVYTVTFQTEYSAIFFMKHKLNE